MQYEGRGQAGCLAGTGGGGQYCLLCLSVSGGSKQPVRPDRLQLNDESTVTSANCPTSNVHQTATTRCPSVKVPVTATKLTVQVHDGQANGMFTERPAAHCRLRFPAL